MHQHNYAGLLPSKGAVRIAAALPLQAPPFLPADFAVYLFHIASEVEGSLRPGHERENPATLLRALPGCVVSRTTGSDGLADSNSMAAHQTRAATLG